MICSVVRVALALAAAEAVKLGSDKTDKLLPEQDGNYRTYFLYTSYAYIEMCV